MIAVFAAFALGGFVLVKTLGFALAVFLDATIIRIAIGPRAPAPGRLLERVAGEVHAPGEWTWPGE